MSIEREVDPARVGFDPRRLATIDTHFARYVDDGRLAGWQAVVTRNGQVAHASTYGQRDMAQGLPVEPDTLWRIFSMTKPITSVAAMMLWEEGHFELTDPISRWLPEFAAPRVYQKGSTADVYTQPALDDIRIWHLLTHTAGLTYGFLNTAVPDALYRAAGYELFPPEGQDLAAASAGWAKLPLLFQPGTAWGYSVATDVLGRLVEVVSGQSLDAFFTERILDPLGMTDTMWWADDTAAPRLATAYGRHPGTGRAFPVPAIGDVFLRKPAFLSGGGGMISSARDYHRFTQMLLGGGEFDGVRLLGNRTVAFMTRNHLPGGASLGELSTGGFAETTFDGIGFGLGFAVTLDPVPSRVPTTPGTYYWGGAASTAFFVDPVERITAMFFTQLVPSSAHPIRSQLRQLIYSALVD